MTLENASKYSKEDVYEAIIKSLPAGLKFAPICFGKAGMNYVFFVETDSEASALMKVSRSVTLFGPNSGQTLTIRVDRAAPPKLNVTDEMWEKAKIVMSNRQAHCFFFGKAFIVLHVASVASLEKIGKSFCEFDKTQAEFLIDAILVAPCVVVMHRKVAAKLREML